MNILNWLIVYMKGLVKTQIHMNVIIVQEIQDIW